LYAKERNPEEEKKRRQTIVSLQADFGENLFGEKGKKKATAPVWRKGLQYFRWLKGVLHSYFTGRGKKREGKGTVTQLGGKEVKRGGDPSGIGEKKECPSQKKKNRVHTYQLGKGGIA